MSVYPCIRLVAVISLWHRCLKGAIEVRVRISPAGHHRLSAEPVAMGYLVQTLVLLIAIESAISNPLVNELQPGQGIFNFLFFDR